MNNKKIQVWLPLLFSITMIVGMYMGYKMRDNIPGKSFFYAEKRRPMQEIMDLIQNKYVDDVKLDSLADTAIQAMLAKLDPHSVFIPATELQAVNEDLAGKFYGVGIEFNIIADTLHVTNVFSGGPSSRAGILIGDKFIAVGDTAVTGPAINVERARKLLRGDKGTQVTVTVMRGKEKKQFAITRDAIPLSSLDAAYMIGNGIGYIRLNKFSQRTYREFMDALTGLKEKGLSKLILDLRGNGGGILEEAVEIADEFLDGDKLITYTEGKHIDKKEYRSRRTGQFETGPVVVLADQGTASASEILIGALQDWDRAIVIGRRTFGKGLVQEQFDLSDNSALRLTVARYYTPLGRSIQRSYSNGEKAYYEELNGRYKEGSTQLTDSTRLVGAKKYKTRSGKTVYGGGGITPDIFIPIDTGNYDINTARVFARGTIGSFAYRFYLDHTEQLKGYKSPAEFIRNFNFTEADWQQFVNMAAKDSIPLTSIPPREKAFLINRIRSTIARQSWRTEGLFEVLNASDDAVKTAIDTLKK